MAILNRDQWLAEYAAKAKAAFDRHGGNPCVIKYGHGPDGKKCKDCALMYVRQRAKKYWKCRLREETGGPGSDHKRNWPTCSKFKEREANNEKE